MTFKVRITEQFASSLQWRGKVYEVWDDRLDGFGIRVWGEGSRKAYVVRAKRGSRQAFKTLGRVGEIKAEAARQVAIAFRGVVKAGRDPRAEEKAARGAWTLDDAMDHFRGDYAEARKLADSYRADMDKLYEHHTPKRWRTMKLTEITQAMLVARHKEITGGVRIGQGRARGGSRRANAWLTLMSKLFQLGIIDGHCTVSPTTGIKKNEETQRERYLSPAELASLWQYLESHDNVEAAVCVQLILLTGCRPGEAYKMKWADVDKVAGIWRKPRRNTKQRKTHHVRLTDEALRVLGKLETWKRSEYVFPSPGDATQPRGDKLRGFWCHACKRLGLMNLRLYDSRHSFAAWLAMGGVSLHAIGKQLGHSSTQTTLRYAHLADDFLKQQAEIMPATIQQALMDMGKDAAERDRQRPIISELKRDGTVKTYCEPVCLSDFE